MTYFDRINDLLIKYIRYTAELPSAEKVLERTAKLMEILGNPQENLRLIHIAGTSGKTSTAYYISALLGQSVGKVGLTISPHVDYVTERVQINNRQFEPQLFYGLLKDYLSVIEPSGIKVTYFELLDGFGFWLFNQEKVDYAVVETGMGGLLDATNIARRPDKLCVITDIGFDHMNILGNKISEITAQKAGIIHDSNSVLTFRQSEEIMQGIEERVSRCGGRINFITPMPPKGMVAEDMPAFQKHNWWLAFNAYQYLAQRDGLEELSQKQLKTSQSIYIPGRMEIIEHKNKILILDGAHNEQKLSALVAAYSIKYPHQKATLLLAFKENKDIREIGNVVYPVADEVILTSFKSSEASPPHATEPSAVAQALTNAGINKVKIEPDEDKALELALNSACELIIVSGSFYLLGQLRQNHPWLKAVKRRSKGS